MGGPWEGAVGHGGKGKEIGPNFVVSVKITQSRIGGREQKKRKRCGAAVGRKSVNEMPGDYGEMQKRMRVETKT